MREIWSRNYAWNNIPPRASAEDARYAWNSMVTGAAAVSQDLWAGYAAEDMPTGNVWMEFEAVTQVARFRLSRTATTGTTIANGNTVNVAAGFQVIRFLVDPRIDKFIDVIAAGVGTFKWRMVGVNIDKTLKGGPVT